MMPFSAAAAALLAGVGATAGGRAQSWTTRIADGKVDGWANSSDGVHTFLTFASGALVRGLQADPADPRARRLDFIWGLSESA